jgi:hypothetical protein
MANISIILGSAIITFLLAYIYFNLSKQNKEDGQPNHVFLQILLFGFLVFMFVIIGKATIDEKDYCSWNIANSTVSGSTTTYGYSYDCEENTNTTALSLFRIVNWIVYLISGYLLIYFIWQLYVYAKEFINKGGKFGD